MNFLEQLVAEWYQYRGYFVRTNIRFGKRTKGGYEGEMDVIAYHPVLKELLHTECSTDAWSWEKKRERFIKKFNDASKYYESIFPFCKDDVKIIRKLVISGFSIPRKKEYGKIILGGENNNIGFITIPEFIDPIISHLSKKSPLSEAIPESYPLLRSMQYGTFYFARKQKNK